MSALYLALIPPRRHPSEDTKHGHKDGASDESARAPPKAKVPAEPQELKALLMPFPADCMSVYPVSSRSAA
jgi:hypothetical protein